MNRVNGAIFSMEQAEDLLVIINSTFSDLDISFHWDCIIYDVDDAVDSKNALDINISDIGGGDTPQMPGTQIEAGYTETFALVIHEIGHALGLLHTHHNSINDNGDETCEEYITPSTDDEEINNGFTCGDCIKSTPATRKLSTIQKGYDPSNNTCTWTPSVLPDGTPHPNSSDIRGIDFFNPHMENIMSYNRFKDSDGDNEDESFDCRSEFVPEQGKRMRNIIEYSGYLDEVRIYDNFSDIDFVNNTFSDGINFGSDIHIDQPLLLPNGAEIAMFGNHRIFIEQGGYIEGNDVTIHRPCGEQWKGIKIHGQTIQDLNTGIKLTGNSSIINAKTGISQQYGDFNGYMELVGTTFLDCERGIELMKSDNDQSIIENCTFTNGKYGITAWENDFTATSCIFNSIYERGIYGIASSPNINNDNNVSEANFKDCNIGILLAFPSGQTSATFIRNNYFLDNSRGVHIVSGAGVDNEAVTVVTNNNFVDNFISFRVSGASAYNLRNNDFIGGTFGNHILAAGADENNISLNNYAGAITGSNLLVENSATIVERNCFDNHVFSDLRVDGIFTNQGTPDLANGNCFSTSNPEIRTGNNGPGFIYFQLPESNPNAIECTLVQSTGNFTVDDSENTVLFDGCGYTTVTGQNIPPLGHSPCNPNKNETDVEQAIADIISLIQEIENNTFFDQDTKNHLIEYYERCLRKNKLLLVNILLSEDRVNEAVEIFRTEEAFDMQIKGYSILLSQDRLIDASTYITNLVAVTQEEIDFVFAQNLYINSLVNSNYTPLEQDLDQLFDNAHKNTVLAGFSRSIYLYFTDDLIELPIELDGHDYIDPRSDGANKSNQKVNVYPNPFSGNEFTISRINKSQEKYELYSSEGVLLEQGLLILENQIVSINSDYTGLIFLKIEDHEGNINITKIVKAQ